MKKLLGILLAGVMTMSMAACGEQSGTDMELVKENGKMVVGITIYEPMNYNDENGELTGFDTEFAKAVAEKLDVDVEFKEINWDTKFVTLDSKQIDCIWNGMTISDEVKDNCDVSKAYVKNAQVVVMKKDAIANYADVESMKDLKFTAEAGSAGEEAIKENELDGKYTPVADQQSAVLAVMGGQADACVIDITMAKSMTAEGSDYASLGYSLELTSEEYGIGFRKSSDLTEKVNQAMDELKADGTLDELAKKYNLTLAE